MDAQSFTEPDPAFGLRHRASSRTAAYARRNSVGGAGQNDSMSDLRGEEVWAAACIEAARPTVEVRQHDDGSAAGMYDLAVYRGGDWWPPSR